MKVVLNTAIRRLALRVGVVALALVGGVVGAAENIGKVRQGLVGGEEVNLKTQETFGLLSIDSSCSASLLRNGWAITAAHCVDADDANGNPIPDPARPGQNRLRPLRSFSIKAAWGGRGRGRGQTKRAVRIETFWPYDVALIELNGPIEVNGKTSGYSRGVFLDQFPYFGTPVGVNLTVFGRGINQFATGKGNSAIPSQSDGKYRMGKVKTTREKDRLYWYPTTGKLMVAGGDSGGPSFATVGTSRQVVLVGVHSQTTVSYVPGKPKDGWKWVTATREAADAPIKPVWSQIERIMGQLPVSPPPSTGRPEARFENTVPLGSILGLNDVRHTLYGVKEDGTLVWHRHIITEDGGRKHSWNPPVNVGTGWKNGFKEIMPAGTLGIYALQDNGTLRLYWHNGGITGSNSWRDEVRTVGTGWTTFWKIIPMDNGVVYGILPDGNLRWQRHLDYRSGLKGVGGWTEPRVVGWGWKKGYKQIFSGGNGILYVVKDDGTLMWYNHKSYLDPVAAPTSTSSNADRLRWQNSWAPAAKPIGTGWSGFTKLFSPGNGHIYGVLPNGDLMWYRHRGWRTGRAMWDSKGSVKIASGWNSYAFAFARITTSDAGHPQTDIVVR